MEILSKKYEYYRWFRDFENTMMINVKGLEIANTLDFGPHSITREKLTHDYFSHPCSDFKIVFDIEKNRNIFHYTINK